MPLGLTGLQVSRLCLGTMTMGTQADERESFAMLDACEDAGLNFIDTADVYPLGAGYADKGETERIVGRWLGAAAGRRERIVLATKGGSPMGPDPEDRGSSARRIVAACDASLARLGVDHIDLYQLHRDDDQVPLDETLRALDTLVTSGRVRHVGVSNFVAWRVARALGRAEALGLARPATVQPRYNLLFRQLERDLLPMCEREGLATLCYNPLAGGLLTGKHRDLAAPDGDSRFGAGRAAKMYRDRYWHEREFAAVQAFVALAQQAQIPPARLAIAWVLAQRGVTCVIVGASRAAQLPDALAAATTELAPDLLARLDDLTREFRLGDAER